MEPCRAVNARNGCVEIHGLALEGLYTCGRRFASFNEQDTYLQYSEKSDPDLHTDPHDPDPRFCEAAAQP